MRPKITVLMAVYNGAAYLKECMDSVLNQTYKDFEFLIINDGSTDTTADIIRSYRDDRIRLIQNGRNLSQVTSLNIGLGCAEGEYIARIDADDTAFPERIERQSEFLKRHPDIALVGSWGEAIDERSKGFLISKLPVRHEEIIAAILVGEFISIHSSFMYRKNTVLGIGRYDEAFSFCEDYKLIIDLLLNGSKVNNMPEALIRYRIHNDRISVRDSKTQTKRYLIAVKKFIKNFINGLADSDCNLLFDFLINAGSMKKAYWGKGLHKTDMEKIIDIYNLLLANVTSYFKLERHQIYFMKRILYSRLLNFAYQGAQLQKSVASELYRYCFKNWPYIFTKPKFYLYPVVTAL